MTRRRAAAFLFALALLAPLVAHAQEAGHHDPFAGVLLVVAVVLVAAKLGGEAAVRVGQAAVLGELVAGIVLGNLHLVGVHLLDTLGTDPGIDLVARLGVLLLLFEVGLGSNVGHMLKVGASSLFVALLGVAAPFALGWGVARWLVPAAGTATHVFVGAALTATSVGITARVLSDLGRVDTREARIVLGAAVIDDVLGLVVLAVVTAMVTGAHGALPPASEIGWIVGKSLGFLVGGLALGIVVSKRVFALAARLRGTGVLLALGLAFCFAFSWAADAAGLAPIVGSFAAGLVLEDAHTERFVRRGEHPLGALLAPITSFLVPVFFVVMGARTDLRVFAHGPVVVLALALTAVAILGKQAAALGVVGKGIDRLAVGLGMIPRGEVGLIFANVGLTLVADGHRVVDASLFASLVAMVILTTMVTPPLLGWRLRRLPRAE